MVHRDFKATNNMEEYEKLIFGVSTALSLRVWQLFVKGDSQLVINVIEPPREGVHRLGSA
jgi:ribonuclease HI